MTTEREDKASELAKQVRADFKGTGAWSPKLARLCNELDLERKSIEGVLMYPIKLLDYSWLPSYGQPVNFMGGVEHPLHQRSLIVPLEMVCQVFNRGEERFRDVRVPVDPMLLVTAELSRSYNLLLTCWRDREVAGRFSEGHLIQGCVPCGEFWEISLWTPEGKLDGVVTSNDFPPPLQNGKAS